MKKQIWIKILLDIVLISSIIACLSIIVIYIKAAIPQIKALNTGIYHPDVEADLQELIFTEIIRSILLSINLIADVIIFIFLNFKDASYLTSSLFKKWKDGKAKREEEKKAKLQAEIAEKQALLDKLNKE